MSQILVDGESHKRLPLDLDISRGAEVAVKLAAGPNHNPLAGELLNLTTPHSFEWKEEDGETHFGSGGRSWQTVTDSEGTLHTRAYPGALEVRADFASSILTKTFETKAKGNIDFEIHHALAGPTYVSGLFTAANAILQIDLETLG